MFKGSELNEQELYSSDKVIVPDGKYLCMVDFLDEKISKTGNPYYRLGLIILDGPQKDKVLDFFLMYQSDKDTVRRSANRVMLELAVACTGNKDINQAEDVLNKTCLVTTKLLNQGKEPFLVCNKIEKASGNHQVHPTVSDSVADLAF